MRDSLAVLMRATDAVVQNTWEGLATSEVQLMTQSVANVLQGSQDALDSESAEHSTEDLDARDLVDDLWKDLAVVVAGNGKHRDAFVGKAFYLALEDRTAFKLVELVFHQIASKHDGSSPVLKGVINCSGECDRRRQ